MINGVDKHPNLLEGLIVVAYEKSITAKWNRNLSYVHFDLGDKNHVRFGHENWCANHPMKVLFTDLYARSLASR